MVRDQPPIGGSIPGKVLFSGMMKSLKPFIIYQGHTVWLVYRTIILVLGHLFVLTICWIFAEIFLTNRTTTQNINLSYKTLTQKPHGLVQSLNISKLNSKFSENPRFGHLFKTFGNSKFSHQNFRLSRKNYFPFDPENS